MANRAETTIALTDAPEDGEQAVIIEGLHAYNEAQAGVSVSPHSPFWSFLMKRGSS